MCNFLSERRMGRANRYLRVATINPSKEPFLIAIRFEHKTVNGDAKTNFDNNYLYFNKFLKLSDQHFER
jgi:diacylglycerol kinase family enzyme